MPSIRNHFDTGIRTLVSLGTQSQNPGVQGFLQMKPRENVDGVGRLASKGKQRFC